MENNFSHYLYLYGRNANLSAKDEKIVIYSRIEDKDNRFVRTLEGIFFCDINLGKENEHLISRKKMDEFETKYSGKFVPF